jgi:hypothetical protein
MTSTARLRSFDKPNRAVAKIPHRSKAAVAPSKSAARLVEALQTLRDKGGRLLAGQSELDLTAPQPVLLGRLEDAGLLKPSLLKLMLQSIAKSFEELAFREGVNDLPGQHGGPMATVPVLRVDTDVEWVDLEWSDRVFHPPKPAGEAEGAGDAQAAWWEQVPAWHLEFRGWMRGSFTEPLDDGESETTTIVAEVSMTALLNGGESPSDRAGTGRASYDQKSLHRFTAPHGDWQVASSGIVEPRVWAWFQEGKVEVSYLVEDDVEGTWTHFRKDGPETSAGWQFVWEAGGDALSEKCAVPPSAGPIHFRNEVPLPFWPGMVDGCDFTLSPIQGGGGGSNSPHNGGDRVGGPYTPSWDTANPLYPLWRAQDPTRQGKKYQPFMPSWKSYTELWLKNSINAGHREALKQTAIAVRKDVDLKSVYTDDMVWFEQQLLHYCGLAGIVLP